MSDYYNLLVRMKYAKQKLNYLWEIKGKTDFEVLKAAEELDILINEYYRTFGMVKGSNNN